MSMTAPEFGRRLKTILKARRMSQSDLAELIWGRDKNTEGKNVARGRDRPSVWCRGLGLPSQDNLEKLAKALDMTVGELMPGGLQSVARPEVTITTHEDHPGEVFVRAHIERFVSIQAALDLIAAVDKLK
jgi:transcriptional regulator with XRE-family HTH domain